MSKLYTEQQMKDCWDAAIKFEQELESDDEVNSYPYSKDEYISSLQPVSAVKEVAVEFLKYTQESGFNNIANTNNLNTWGEVYDYYITSIYNKNK